MPMANDMFARINLFYSDCGSSYRLNIPDCETQLETILYSCNVNKQKSEGGDLWTNGNTLLWTIEILDSAAAGSQTNGSSRGEHDDRKVKPMPAAAARVAPTELVRSDDVRRVSRREPGMVVDCSNGKIAYTADVTNAAAQFCQQPFATPWNNVYHVWPVIFGSLQVSVCSTPGPSTFTWDFCQTIFNTIAGTCEVDGEPYYNVSPSNCFRPSGIDR
jgi:hypothetical protein